MEALHRLGVANPARNFIVISQGPLNNDGIAVAVLAKKSAFTAGEETAVLNHLAGNPSLSSLYLPSSYRDNPFGRLIASNNPSAFAADYAYNVAPVSDNAPFFFFTLKLGQILRPSALQQGIDWKVNLGVAVLFMVLVISIVAVLAFLVIPLWMRGSPRGQSAVSLLYFIAIGLGYILVEIAFIQRFVLFLGHPTYALTVVVFLLLLSSGGGSLLSRRWATRERLSWLPLIAISAALLLYVFILPGLLNALVGWPFFAKLLVSGGLLIPLGLIMGMPFPTGMRAIASLPVPEFPAAADGAPNQNSVEWAWAMNAASSVLGSVLAMVVAIQFGLNATLACGSAAYLLALVLTPTLHPRLR